MIAGQDVFEYAGLMAEMIIVKIYNLYIYMILPAFIFTVLFFPFNGLANRKLLRVGKQDIVIVLRIYR